MRSALIGRWVRAGILSLLVALHPAGVPAGRLLAPVLALSAAAGAAFAPAESWAKPSKSSSGGYSRPSSSSRTPSASSGSSGGYARPSAPRTPSASTTSRRDAAPSSGGYSRPGSSAAADRPAAATRPAGAGDQALSRQAAAESLDRYRSRAEADRAPSVRAPASAPASGRNAGAPSSSAGSRWSDSIEIPQVRTPRSAAPARPADAWNRYGWTPPAYAAGSAPRFGLWNGLFLWFLLDTLNRPGHAAFFHDHADDPGVRAWRAEAEQMAAGNPDLRRKLGGLTSAVASVSGEPRAPGRLPPDVPADLARSDGGTGGFGVGAALGVTLLLLGVLFLLWYMWRRRRAAASPSAATATATAKKETTSVPLFGTIGNYVSRKLSGERYSPSLFRLGMTLTIDPAPFLLAAGVTKVEAPEAGGSDRLAGVDGVGTVRVGNVAAHRLYLPGGKGFFQIHLNADGQPDECRFFTVIDEITPADEGEWAFWLDDAEGMVGWPEFQTKDGKLYARAWAPGTSRIPPFAMTESIETVRGTRTVNSRAMLYAAATGAAEPAPETEYILVQVIEDGGQAWVQVAAGIDVNPASLTLA